MLDAWIKILLKGGRGLTPIQALLSNFLFKFGYYEHFFAAYFPHQKKFLVGVRELVEGGGFKVILPKFTNKFMLSGGQSPLLFREGFNNNKKH